MEIQINLSIDDTFIDNLFDTVWDHAHAEGSYTSKWADLFRIKGHPVFIVKDHEVDEADAVTTTQLVTAVIDLAFGDDLHATWAMRLMRTQDLNILDAYRADVLIGFIVEGRLTEND